ncbi:MAG: lipocalin family protein [Bacteroidia bacterium]
MLTAFEINHIQIDQDFQRINKSKLIGKWVISNFEPSSYKIHDTIEFENNKRMITSIVSNTKNYGKWRLNKNKLVMKACLHNSDNPFMCRNFNWIWTIEKLSEDSMFVKPNNISTTFKYGRINKH